jgi:outer membrane protein TolC
VIAADRAVAAARQGVEVAFGQYYPSISLNLNYFLERDSFPSGAEWSGLLRANLPIFSAGLIEADVRAAWSRYRQAALAAALVRREVSEQVEQSHANLLSSEQRLAELQFKLRAARDASTQAEESYTVGLATNLERLTAQDELLRTQLQLTGEQFDRTVHYLNLVRTVGGLREHIAAAGPATRPSTQPSTQPASQQAAPRHVTMR